MTAADVSDQLRRIAGGGDFAARSAEPADSWAAAGAGVETVQPILLFIEANPQFELGTPGPVVHFLERFRGRGYEEKLVESIARRPTTHTDWMLNRLIHGTTDPGAKRMLLDSMRGAALNPLTDENARREIRRFLQRLGA
jgi:hypothetical protein